MKIKDPDQGSIRFILEGSEEGLKNILKSFNSGELASLFQDQFDLELEDVQLIEPDSSENHPKDRSQKLLAFTIAGNVSQSDIDILKASLINTSNSKTQ